MKAYWDIFATFAAGWTVALVEHGHAAWYWLGVLLVPLMIAYDRYKETK